MTKIFKQIKIKTINDLHSRTHVDSDIDLKRYIPRNGENFEMKEILGY